MRIIDPKRRSQVIVSANAIACRTVCRKVRLGAGSLLLNCNWSVKRALLVIYWLDLGLYHGLDRCLSWVVRRRNICTSLVLCREIERSLPVVLSIGSREAWIDGALSWSICPNSHGYDHPASLVHHEVLKIWWSHTLRIVLTVDLLEVAWAYQLRTVAVLTGSSWRFRVDGGV